jgi:hypothetical protein
VLKDKLLKVPLAQGDAIGPPCFLRTDSLNQPQPHGRKGQSQEAGVATLTRFLERGGGTPA